MTASLSQAGKLHTNKARMYSSIINDTEWTSQYIRTSSSCSSSRNESNRTPQLVHERQGWAPLSTACKNNVTVNVLYDIAVQEN